MVGSHRKARPFGLSSKGVVDRLAADMQRVFPELQGFSAVNVLRMRAFYLAYRFGPTIPSQAVTELAADGPLAPVADIPWGHNVSRPGDLRHAKSLFAKRVSHWISECRPLAMSEVPMVTVRKMTRRWGSCTSGTITLNLDLVKVPLTFIDYVIVHGLCHLKIHSHSPAFYKLLTRSMPDWKQRKERLESFVN